MLSALMLCWRNDNTALQPAEMISQHPICISKPGLNSSAICVRVRSCAPVQLPEQHTHTHKHGCILNPCCLCISQRQLVPSPSQLQFIPDKLSYCFSEIIKKKLNYSPINIPATWSSSLFLWERLLWYHLSSCLFVLKELSFKGRLYSVWTQYTSTADVTIAADIDSFGLGPARLGAVLIEGQMLKAQTQRVFHDRNWAFHFIPESVNKGRVEQCHVSRSWEEMPAFLLALIANRIFTRLEMNCLKIM